MQLRLELAKGVATLDARQWNTLVGDMPLLSYAFLSALELSGSVGEDTGWQPAPLLVYQNEVLLGAVPLYIKTHSYGEYVFDWAWADAYAHSGFAYYPKLLSAIPFTPITSPRLLSADAQVKSMLVDALDTIMRDNQLSSAHVLFPDPASAAEFEKAGWIRRNGVQFRWENEGFSSFEDFLNTLSHDKRKKIRQERKKISASAVRCVQLTGSEISADDWAFFYRCYQNTYYEHRSTPYLTPEFFTLIGQHMPENILLILAYQGDEPIAAALNIYDSQTLYGRYWGALKYVPNLHFELCYYQAQMFCIAQNIQFFEGGAQGEHKLARGFKPRPTCSFHRIAHPDFSKAIADFIRRESAGIAQYTNELEDRVPFKASADS